MENYDFNELSHGWIDSTHITGKIERAIERAADTMMSKAETGIYDGDIPIEDSELIESLPEDDAEELIDEYSQELKSMMKSDRNYETIIDTGSSIIVYQVESWSFSFTAKIGCDVVNSVISMVTKAVEDEVEDGYVPALEKDNTLINAFKSLCSIVKSDANSFFDGDLQAKVNNALVFL